jgi:hypothetical protein
MPGTIWRGKTFDEPVPGRLALGAITAGRYLSCRRGAALDWATSSFKEIQNPITAISLDNNLGARFEYLV